jgi:uncharacterized membrane protein YbhN (UPF0104 family)
MLPNSKPAPFLSNRQLRWLIWTSVLSCVGYLGLSITGGWADVTHASRLVGATGLIIALLLSILNYLLRFARWQYFLKLFGCQIPIADSLGIYLAGFGLTIVPGKAGEAVRSVFLKNRGMDFQPSLAAFLSERISDLIGVLALAAIGVWSFPNIQWIVIGLAIAMLIMILAINYQKNFGFIGSLATRALPMRFHGSLNVLSGILCHARQCFSILPLMVGLAVAVVAWGAEAYAFYLILSLMDTPISWQVAIFIYAFSMLVGAVSFMPGGLGGVEGTMIGLLILSGTSHPEAIAATVVIRLTTLWFAVLIGLAAMIGMLKKDASSTGARSQ